MPDLPSLVAASGIAAEIPLALAAIDRTGTLQVHVSGHWPDGQPVTSGDRFYGASLAKQVTGAAAALLVMQSRLDPDAPICRHLDGLPSWAGTIAARNLAHHIAGLPEAGIAEAAIAGDWTETAASAYLAGLTTLPATPGTEYRYSNLGYILLARLVARVSETEFAGFADSHLSMPDGMGFPSDIRAFPQAAMLGTSRPLTQGDGGLWTSAGAFVRWLDTQNRDPLGLAPLVTAAARLSDGSVMPYGWGLGLRRFRGEVLLIHGGEWHGATAKSLRCPALGLSVVALSAGAPLPSLVALADAALDMAAATG